MQQSLHIWTFGPDSTREWSGQWVWRLHCSKIVHSGVCRPCLKPVVTWVPVASLWSAYPVCPLWPVTPDNNLLGLSSVKPSDDYCENLYANQAKGSESLHSYPSTFWRPRWPSTRHLHLLLPYLQWDVTMWLADTLVVLTNQFVHLCGRRVCAVAQICFDSQEQVDWIHSFKVHRDNQCLDSNDYWWESA